MKSSSILTAFFMALASPAATAPSNPGVSDVALPQTSVSDVAQFNATENETVIYLDDPDDLPNVWCEVHQPGWLNHYKVIIRKVPKEKIPNTCHRLWAGLRVHWWICLASRASCEEAEVVKNETAIEWKFTTAATCNAGAIASAYWEVTRNEYGAMDQSKCN